jgi:SAM-dependent methyltransferase
VDRWLGVDTYEQVALRELALEHPERGPYEGTGWRVLRRMLAGSPVTPADVFLDLGAGKGRVVLQAARLPFGRVIGVELAPQLAEVARRNVARMGDRLVCRDVQVVTADAAEYRVPDDVTVAYLFNPFTGATFDRALDNLFASLDRRPRPLRLVYVHPTEHARLMARPRVRLARAVATPRRYRWLGRGSAPERFGCLYVLER